MSKTSAKPPKPESMSYEEAIGELESIIGAIEQGEVGLEESLTRYSRGADLLKRCRSILEKAEQDLQRLTPLGETKAKGDPPGGQS